jgi:hypothetical protein
MQEDGKPLVVVRLGTLAMVSGRLRATTKKRKLKKIEKKEKKKELFGNTVYAQSPRTMGGIIFSVRFSIKLGKIEFYLQRGGRYPPLTQFTISK